MVKVVIGDLVIDTPVFLAPMAGVTDSPFRQIAVEMGAGLVFTEMVSAEAVVHGSEKTMELARFSEMERPIGIQLFGRRPESLAGAAQQLMTLKPDLIDINMGCPVPKVVRNGAGAALMRDLSMAYEAIRAVVEAVAVPVTVKIRKGWSEDECTAPDLAQVAQEAGASAVTVHGRTRDQFYQGTADWTVIGQVKERVSIPVIGNGDILSPFDVVEMMSQTKCDAVMIGRAARGNPWIFKQCVQLLATGHPGPEPSLEERLALALRQLEMTADLKGEHIAVLQMRKHISWYLRGLPASAQVRQLVNGARTLAEYRKILDDYRCSLRKKDLLMRSDQDGRKI